MKLRYKLTAVTAVSALALCLTSCGSKLPQDGLTAQVSTTEAPSPAAPSPTADPTYTEFKALAASFSEEVDKTDGILSNASGIRSLDELSSLVSEITAARSSMSEIVNKMEQIEESTDSEACDKAADAAEDVLDVLDEAQSMAKNAAGGKLGMSEIMSKYKDLTGDFADAKAMWENVSARLFSE